MKKNIFAKNGKVKKLVIFGGVVAILGSGIALMSCNGCNSNIDDMSMSDSNNKDESSKNNVPVSSSSTTSSSESIIEDKNEESNEIEPAVVYMTAEDLVKLSGSYAEYLNKVGIFQTNNYTYNKFETKDLYAAIYLSNIDCFTDEETSRLIDMGIINDDIGSVVVNSFKLFSFYKTDTINKVRNNDTNLIDLSLIFVNDEKAKEVSNIMNKVLNEMNTDDKGKISSNFIDTYAYFAMGVELPVQNYDYSKSIYTSDRAELSIGSEYALSYAAEVIKDLSVEKGVTTNAIGKKFSKVINDRSNIVRVFEGCVAEKENTNETSKVLTK